ncbi:carbamoyltransferase HypF [Halarcobacter ebronensis]|uniref:Carbamoyltransferase n=1 Tax=Halarcobacter ebronensis TaxID=1462615 RepID=A0A4Q1AL94_9BACT|nr:carbamoyltransferase HypF [Halarcobacter ebronensis]QKF81640.1 [Ni-Fe] hydrogenase maturation protein HypF [Halarcobacter ebronensis]RXK05564.1 carbamoyltransferase HypF [Halarcobacter ebronensis]
MDALYIEVKGIVQGVGFRPFVYTLALKNKLFGWVNNDDKGVNIHLEGNSPNIKNFLDELKKNPPPLAKIDSISVKNIKIKNYNSFEIIKSETTSNKSTIISPDMAICQECIDDIKNKNNFRYNYALTNCTNCGPRYTIIKTVPYDRANTSMANFEMCDDCKKEYENPTNRRYHAQPVSCQKCGPQITLFDKQNQILATELEAIKEIANKINSGEIVAIKGMGGFHLICDATNDKTLKELRKRKNRPSKPFAVMFKDIEQLKEFAEISIKEQEIILSKEKPITLVKSKKNLLSFEVAPHIDRVGCFVPYTPLHIILFNYLDNPIVATSANLSDEPIIRSKDELLKKLGNVVDFVLDFDREIINACDDSVVQVVNDELMVLRDARGYAPTSLKLDKKIDKKILALGANQKSTIALAFEDNLILSPHIGDLNSLTSMEYFQRTIKTFESFYDFRPELIVCDKHPNYESVKWALNQDIKVVQIQHHYAHVLSTMAEYKLDEEVLAFSFDGTGYGDDGNIWGGEVFLANKRSYKRVNHFKYFRLLGGEKSIKEPKRVALSLLFDTFSLEEILELKIPTVEAFLENEIKLMHTIWQKGLNAPLTSSLGRVFDAIASFSNIVQTQSYEGETGLQIEMAYNNEIKESYSYELIDGIISLEKAIKQIVKDNNKELICSKFINMLVEIVLDISKSYNLPIILTGGVFQNRTLLELITKKLEENKRKYYYSKRVPLNDGGISIGQIYSQS